MQRVRRAAPAVLALVVVLCLSSGPVTALPVTIVQAASVAWPPSTLVVSEVQTGGASASDEFVEIANQGSGPVDLIGLELVYSTSSGSTVTRKATWTASTILQPGTRLLVVNGVGIYASIGDAAYSGGFAATGGAVALRVVGGTVVDAIGWGDATNPFVEGSAALAPPAASSLERRPGGALGNGTDTNDNSLDWFVAQVPGPQNLASPPIPDPGATPSPTASASPTVEPSPSASPTPSPTSTPTPSPTDTAEPSATPTEPSATPEPTPSATPEATPEPTPSPTPAPTATPEPTPSPTTAPTSIAAARALPDGASVTVSGILTTDLGALESGRTAFIEDETGGIALYLDATVVSPLPAGTVVLASGVVDERYAQRTLRVTESDLVLLGTAGLPPANDAATGAATEALEGTRIRVSGVLIGTPDSLADGSAISVDDGSGPVRVIVTPAALGGRDLGSGSMVTAKGPLGQRDSTGTGASGYRIYVTLPEEITIEPPATPSPMQTPSSTPEPTSSPSSTPDPGVSPTPLPSPTASAGPPSPTPSPTPTSNAMSIAAARALPVGSTVSVRGVVSAEPGRLGTPALFAIADDTGGILVKLPDGIAPPARGRMVDVRGPLADPYGQLEIRPGPADLSGGGTGDLPAPVTLSPSGPSESSEGRLVRIDGLVVVRPQKATSGDIGLTIETANGTRVRIMADASSGIGTSAFAMDARYRITGIAGQRASKKGVPDGYRVWVRDPADIDLLAGPPSGSSASPSAGGSQKPQSPATISIAAALRVTDRDVAIAAVVTAPATLLDASGRRIVVQDGSGAVEILLPKDGKAPTVGTRVHVVGRVGSAYGAPRLRASAVERRGSGSVPAPLRVAGPLTAAHTWRLVSLGGRVEDVRKLGDRWRGEVVVGAQRLVVVGQPGSRIPSSALVEGRSAEVVGVVRPAYPSASDRRPSVLPRTAGDIRLGGATAVPGSSSSARGPRPSTAGSTAMSANLPVAPDADLVDLAAHLGQTVRVGGLVVDLRPTGFTLDDGSATGRIELVGPAADMLALIEPDDAINVVGVVRNVEGGKIAVVVDDPGAIALGSSLDGNAATAPDGSSEAALIAPDVVAAGLGGDPSWLPGAGAGLAGLLGISVASVVAAVVWRRHGRHLLTDRIAVRLAALGGPRAAPRDRTTS
jgi:uncharacterized protein YdeI (BOF family)